jgi:hypothetical protein
LSTVGSGGNASDNTQTITSSTANHLMGENLIAGMYLLLLTSYYK